MSTPIQIDVNKPGYFHASELGEASSAYYRENGFIVVNGALSVGELKELREETVAICRGERGEIFSRDHQDSKQVEQLDLHGLSDAQVLEHFLCIHHAHKFSPVMHKHLGHPAIVKALTGCIGPNVKCMQSMLFIKTAGKPGQAWHQDEDYIPTRDRSLAGAWMAIDDAVIENGCLWVIPGSHRRGILWPQYPHQDERFDCAFESYDFPYTDDDAVPVEVPAGSIVFFNGYLLHRSLPNVTASNTRMALVNHYMSAESFLPWGRVIESDDVSVAKHDYRDIVMIAGQDPYAWKGTTDMAKPHVRPAGDGGCGDGRMELEQFREEKLPERIKA